MSEMNSNRTSNRILALLGAVVAVLIVVGVVFGMQPPPQFDPGSPEAAAQGFYEAAFDDDEELAATYLTVELNLACDGDLWFRSSRTDARVVMTRSEVEGDQAEIDVAIDISAGDGPFGGISYLREESIVLEMHDDVWLISESTWPMDSFSCEQATG